MFRVGQKVVCVDASGNASLVLREGNIYVVIGPAEIKAAKDCVMIDCKPLNQLRGNRDWMASRFRPIIERKTDISIFKAMLTPAGKKERVNAR